jgi:acetyltransferase-like isoleucine patch superfamily enzyme
MFEPPCSIKWLRAEHSFEMGAFSYAVSGYFFACTIGRYCSLGEQVQVGRHSHPLDFVSTSPIFYRQAIDVLGVGKHSSLNNKPSRPSREPTALKQTVIGHDVYIGHGAFLLPGIVVGHGAVIGACSVVTKDVPPYAVVAGSPATIKRYRFDSLTVQNLLVSKWWNYAPSDLGDLDPAFPNDYIERVALLQSQGRAKYAPAKIILGDFAQTASRSF